VKRAIALVALLGGCSGPADARAELDGLVCGYQQTRGSPHRWEGPGCALLAVTAPAGALLATADVDACDVEALGSTCLVVAPKTPWTAWLPAEQQAQASWDIWPAELDDAGACPLSCD
jgi:hypothetical protein